MINLEPGQIFDEKYQLIRLIDTGGFSEVWEAKFLTAGNIVALKVYPRLDEEGVKNLELEYSRLFELQHSHLLNALHFGKYLGYPYLVMRYYTGGNASKKIGEMNESEIAKCISQIAGALYYLHSNDIVHQDIKPNNFLLDQKGNYYLGDLGLSLKLRNTITRQTQLRSDAGRSGSTPAAYRAPELWEKQDGKFPLKETDIWAFGASLYEMITGELPFGDLGGFFEKNKRTIEPLPAGFSNELFIIINNCIEIDPNKRPTALQLEDWAHHYLMKGYWFSESGVEATQPLPVWNVTPDSPNVTWDSKNPASPAKKKNPGLVLVFILVFAIFATIIIGVNMNPDDSSAVQSMQAIGDTTSINPGISVKDTSGTSQGSSSQYPDTPQDVITKQPITHKAGYYETIYNSDYVKLARIGFDPWYYDISVLEDSVRNHANLRKDVSFSLGVGYGIKIFAFVAPDTTQILLIDSASITRSDSFEKFKTYGERKDEVFIDLDRQKAFIYVSSPGEDYYNLYIFNIIGKTYQ